MPCSTDWLDGYTAHMDGLAADDNPHDYDIAPRSFSQWDSGFWAREGFNQAGAAMSDPFA